MASCPPPLVCSAGTAPADTGTFDWLSRLSGMGLQWYNTIVGPSQQRAAPTVNLPQSSSAFGAGGGLGGFLSGSGGQLLIVAGIALGAVFLLRRR